MKKSVVAMLGMIAISGCAGNVQPEIKEKADWVRYNDDGFVGFACEVGNGNPGTVALSFDSEDLKKLAKANEQKYGKQDDPKWNWWSFDCRKVREAAAEFYKTKGFNPNKEYLFEKFTASEMKDAVMNILINPDYYNSKKDEEKTDE